jgi:hypothetical protein
MFFQIGHDVADIPVDVILGVGSSPLALKPLRFRLAGKIQRLGLGLVEAVTVDNCGKILLDIDASIPELCIIDELLGASCDPAAPADDVDLDTVDSDTASVASVASYDPDAPADDADIETWSAYWQTLANPYG